MQVLVVDDHPIIISGCRSILAAEADISVISAQDGSSALRLQQSERPDIVLVDLNLPDMSGFDLIQKMLQFDPATRIIVLTMTYDPIHAARAIESGAKGYLGKGEDPARLLSAVQTVAAGRKFAGPDMIQSLAFLNFGKNFVQLGELTRREHEVLHLLRQGRNLVEIAETMQLSYKTIANTCVTLKRKLGAHSITDLARIALQREFD